MRTCHRLVDSQGDEIALNLLGNNVEIPVKVKSIKYSTTMAPGEEPEMWITWEYQHGAIEPSPAEKFIDWLLLLDDPDYTRERARVTLNDVIRKARRVRDAHY